MRLALREARKGLGWTSPNPCVGAVVVRHGRVVGRGYHHRAGALHAEPLALQDAGRHAKGATLYVTLEPCNHQGRTPPCTKAILASSIARVVVGMRDPNPGVAGNGNDFLRHHGLEVDCPVMEEACQEINRPFIKFASTGLPWVVMKAGMSLDGRIAARVGVSTAITNERTRLRVHRLRHQVDAIVVGIDTALVDDPSLTTRLPGRRSKDPLRVVLDSSLRLPPTARMLTQESTALTWVFCAPDADPHRRRALEAAGAVVKPASLTGNQRLDLHDVLRQLAEVQVNSVLVEGGGAVHGAFLAAGLVDQVFLFVAPIFLGDQGVPLIGGWPPPVGVTWPRLADIRVQRFDDDILIEGRMPSGLTVSHFT